jgi:hypothetical protein
MYLTASTCLLTNSILLFASSGGMRVVYSTHARLSPCPSAILSLLSWLVSPDVRLIFISVSVQ